VSLFARTARRTLARLPSPLRGGVGGGGQRALNLAQHPFKIAKYIVIPEAQNAIAGGLNTLRAQRIGRLLPIMLPAIEFDDELCLPTGKIHDKWADQSLPPKMRACQSDVMAKPLPEHALGIRRLCAHLTRKLSLAINHRSRFNHIRHHLWTPTPDPSPQGGGEKRRRRNGKIQRKRWLITLALKGRTINRRLPLRCAPRLRRRLSPVRARAGCSSAARLPRSRRGRRAD